VRNGKGREVTERDVRPNPSGGWDVLIAGGQDLTSHHATNVQALVWAKTVLRQRGGGVVKVYDRDGHVAHEERV
jgi:hypothetical protein